MLLACPPFCSCYSTQVYTLAAVGKQPGAQRTVASFPVGTPLSTLQTPVLASHSLSLDPTHVAPSLLSLTPQLGTAPTPHIVDGSLCGSAAASKSSKLGSGHLRDCSQSLSSGGLTTFRTFLPPQQGQASALGILSGTPAHTSLPAGGSQSAAAPAGGSARQQIPSVSQLGKLQQFSQFLEGCVFLGVCAEFVVQHGRPLSSGLVARTSANTLPPAGGSA
jgi:hypothetical protein